MELNFFHCALIAGLVLYIHSRFTDDEYFEGDIDGEKKVKKGVDRG